MMATDWTFDLFNEDSKLYKATPVKGVYCNSNATDRAKFMTWFKNLARDFKQEWLKEHDGHLYDRRDGWAGDAFERRMCEACFSDYYKDTYNQRPHLPRWFYVQAVGLPHSEDVIRTFCSFPISQACADARCVRASF